jgi:hypothetical protein
LAARLRAVGLEVLVVDGQRTVKGWGSPALQRENLHGKPVSGDDLETALGELEETASRLHARWAQGELRHGSPAAARTPVEAPRRPPLFSEALERYGNDGWAEQDELATRKAYGLALPALGHVDPRVAGPPSSTVGRSRTWT